MRTETVHVGNAHWLQYEWSKSTGLGREIKGLRVWSLGFRVEGLELRGWGSGFRV